MKIAIGSDHRGFQQKKDIQQVLSKKIDWVDVGAFDMNRSDYPEFAKKVCQLIKAKEVDYGILLCGSGIGMAIAANRFKGIYAAVAWNEEVARLAKEHDNVNVLCLASDFIDNKQAIQIVESWIDASFKNDRYLKRLQMIDSWDLC